MAKVRVIVEFTLMPMRMEASLSSETARMALPCLVWETNSCNAIMMMTPSNTVTIVAPSIFRSPMVSDGIWIIVGMVW